MKTRGYKSIPGARWREQARSARGWLTQAPLLHQFPPYRAALPTRRSLSDSRATPTILPGLSFRGQKYFARIQFP